MHHIVLSISPTPDVRDALGMRAVVWVDREPRLLEGVLAEAGGILPEGWVLRDVRAISADGRVMAGNGTNAAGDPEAFRIVWQHGL